MKSVKNKWTTSLGVGCDKIESIPTYLSNGTVIFWLRWVVVMPGLAASSLFPREARSSILILKKQNAKKQNTCLFIIDNKFKFLS